MTEVGVVGERGSRQPALQVGDLQPGAEGATHHRRGARLVLAVDGAYEGVLVILAHRLGERVGRPAQAVVGDMPDDLGETDQPRFIVAGALVVEREPVGRPGIGMGPSELEPVVGPRDRLDHRLGRHAPGKAQTLDLACDAGVVVVVKRIAQA